MEKRIPLQTTERKFYKQALELLNPILKLRKKELDVLAELMLRNNSLRSVPPEHRIRLLLDSASRKEMRLLTKQSEAAYNNNLSKLKKYKYVTEFGLKKFLDFPYSVPFKLTFEFTEK